MSAKAKAGVSAEDVKLELLKLQAANLTESEWYSKRGMAETAGRFRAKAEAIKEAIVAVDACFAGARKEVAHA